MQGDFSRLTFDAAKNYSRVLMQQGRVLLDADWNEMVETQLHALRALAIDIGGEHWGPARRLDNTILIEQAAFKIDNLNDFDFSISPGIYYVQGLRCEVGTDAAGNALTYNNHRDYPLPDDEKLDHIVGRARPAHLLIYLDVWEVPVTHWQDGALREVALGGPDTTVRTKVVWQVRAKRFADSVNLNDTSGLNQTANTLRSDYRAFLQELGLIDASGAQQPAMMQARAKRPADDTDPCRPGPEARFRGVENQLYRVEIHRGSSEATADRPVTFKWSRENGAVVFPITLLSSDRSRVSLANLGRDPRFSLQPGDWVEIVDDAYALQNRAAPLRQVETVDYEQMEVTLKGAPASDVGTDAERHPLLRRWDHKADDASSGTVKVIEWVQTAPDAVPQDSDWITLEDGVQILFPTPTAGANTYNPGDYWLITARTGSEDIEWPKLADKPVSQPARGVAHYFAPLGIISFGVARDPIMSLRRILRQSWEPG